MKPLSARQLTRIADLVDSLEGTYDGEDAFTLGDCKVLNSEFSVIGTISSDGSGNYRFSPRMPAR